MLNFLDELYCYFCRKKFDKNCFLQKKKNALIDILMKVSNQSIPF